MARPRKHPEGTTSSDRKRVSRSALVASGGSIKQFALSPRATESLVLVRAVAGDATDTALVERLLEEERGRLLPDHAASGASKSRTDRKEYG